MSVSDGIALGRRPELVGGGLVRSLGDWSQVVSFRRKGETVNSDVRILGGSGFVEPELFLKRSEKKKRRYDCYPARSIYQPCLRRYL